MASLIRGYEYDIFISYRQKDNKGDKWVSEFVEALKVELESTFKEEISVYFDVNPHDGLLDTHDVDASLKEKLKCLIFIPIISRTYCDPKSFAWEHEFKAFVQLASQDQFGLKVKLTNGNVASRVLPVRIHDLDPSDIRLYELILDGVLRGIEFVYEEPGVNRPLTPGDDENKNLKKTRYKNQINKVALAVSEIFRGLETEPEWERFETRIAEEEFRKTEELIEKETSTEGKVFLKNKSKVIGGIIFGLVLIILGYFIITAISKPKEQLEKSIAVLPFKNNSSDSTNQHFIDGTMEAILDKLCKIADLKVISRTSVKQFRNTTNPIQEIAKRLNVNYILEGSGQRYGNNIRLNVQLIDAAKDKNIWSYPYEGEAKDIFKLETGIAESVATELKAIVTPEEKQLIEKKPTKNLDAYNFYQLGRFYLNQNFEESLREGIKSFEQAIKLDPEYAMAYIGLAQCYQFLVRYSGMSREEGYPKAKKAILKAIELDNSLGDAYATLGLIMIVFDWDIYGPEQEFQKAIKLSPNSAEVYSSYAQYLRWLGRYDEGVIVAKHAAELDPLSPITNFWLPAIYFYSGRYDESIDYLKKMMVRDSNYVHIYTYLASNYIFKGSYSEAIYYADKALSFEEVRNSPLVLCPLGWVYAKSGKIDKAREILSWVEELYADKKCDPVTLAVIYDGLGEREKAINLILKAYEVHSNMTIYLKVNSDSWLKDIGSDPRYIDLLKNIGFKVK